jgi:hypothetical protein
MYLQKIIPNQTRSTHSNMLIGTHIYIARRDI